MRSGVVRGHGKLTLVFFTSSWMDKAHFITSFLTFDKAFRSQSYFLVASNSLTASMIPRVSGYTKHCLSESIKIIPAKSVPNFLVKLFLADLIMVSVSSPPSHS